ncbi:hypothetical protein BJY04DRAFT_229703 [Aspergillus karnatakaensis]|uniref:uncharacterized protein n=1 Tax=Aspergillus karnatakaensis TaxID=1810916 RepID=UPI003CCE0360
MTSSQFQLFPPPAPQGVPKNPFRKGPRRPSIDAQSIASTALEDPKDKAAEAKAVIFQVVEPHSIKPPPAAHVPPLPPRSFTPELRPSTSSESLYSSSPQVERRAFPATEGTQSNTSTDRNGGGLHLSQIPPPPSVSPIIPLKSIFPQFNPNAPPSQPQHNRAGSSNFSRPRRPTGLKLNITPAPEIDRALGPKTVPADVHDFPAGVLSPVEIQYSSAEQLRILWEAANGQRADDIPGPFNLRLERLEPATFVFGDPNSPFYTMQTFSTNEVSITRGNPSVPNSSIPIMMLQLEDRRRREPPNDGLVSHLFSRLAAMLAIDQATELSRLHQLSPPDAAEVEANALKKAAALESRKLSWSPIKRVYELRHPSLTRQYQSQEIKPATPPALVGAAGAVLSPALPQKSGALHISVSTPNESQGQGRGQSSAPTILVTAPLPNIPADVAAVASPRTSTLPLSGSESESDETLASLDLRTMTLSISASAITNAIPSLYAIDSIVAAILAVAVSDVYTNPVLGDLSIYDPTKTETRLPTPPQPAHTNTPSNRPKLFATLAERDDLDPPTPALDIPTQPQTQILKTNRKWWSAFRSKLSHIQSSRRQRARAKLRSPTSPVVEEIDLEKYGIRSSPVTKADKKDEELPGLARGIIKLIGWGFKLMFWALTVAFKLLSWILGLIFKAVTGEKA